MFGNYYKNTAEVYDQRWKRYTEHSIDKVIQYLPQKLENKSVLDYGCGTGALIRRLLVFHPHLKQVTGYDPVEDMLQQARRKMQNLPESINQKVKWQSHQNFAHKFDIIVSTSVLHYLPKPHEELVYLKSLLQEEGILILLDYTKNGLLAKYFEWLIKRIDTMHQKAYQPHQIIGMVKHAGFTVHQNEAFKITPLWNGIIVRAEKE